MPLTSLRLLQVVQKSRHGKRSVVWRTHRQERQAEPRPNIPEDSDFRRMVERWGRRSEWTWWILNKFKLPSLLATRGDSRVIFSNYPYKEVSLRWWQLGHLYLVMSHHCERFVTWWSYLKRNTPISFCPSVAVPSSAQSQYSLLLVRRVRSMNILQPNPRNQKKNMSAIFFFL